MGQIFISYSRRDTDVVDQVAVQMKNAGLDVWIDREAIKAGDTWRVQIVQAIDTCLAFVLMLSPNSAASDNVRREIDLAQDVEGPLLPFQLEQVKIPPEIRYQLAGQQIIDVQMLGFEKAVSELIEIIREHIQKLQPAAGEDSRQVELVIQGIELKDLTAEKQEQLLDFLAQLSNSDRSQLQLANLAPGSIHAFVDMPVQSAYELKTLALNRDKRFKQFGITCLRLHGDTRFINTSLGIPTKTATLSLLQTIWLRIPPLLRSIFSVNVGKILTVILVVLILAGASFAAAQSFSTPVTVPSPTPSPTVTQAATPTVAASATATLLPTETITPSPTFTATSTFTPTPVATATPIPTYQVLRGTVQNVETLNCRYGPGSSYLNKYGLNNRSRVEVGGRMEIQSGDQTSVWLYLPEGFQEPCWVNAEFIKLDGDISSLEPNYYPDKAPLKPFNDFPPPKNVKAVRSESDQVSISWEGYTLEPGDREKEELPTEYLVEAWTCQAGKFVFTPISTYDENLLIRDEAECDERSHARLFMEHRDGYIGPVEIPWPAYPTP